MGLVVRRLRAGFSGYAWVGKELDGELAQLVRQAGLTSAQTSAVIPAGHAPSLRPALAESRTPPSHHLPLLYTDVF